MSGVLQIDCNSCLVRGPGCSDCVVTAILGPIDDLTLSHEEQLAISTLANTGLVAPLRLVTSVDTAYIESA